MNTDFELFRGNDLDIEFQILKDGAPFSLVGVGEVQFFAKAADGSTKLDKNIAGGGVVVVVAVEGRGRVKILSADTSTLANESDAWAWNLHVKDSGGLRSTVATGTISLFPVTNIIP